MINIRRCVVRISSKYHGQTAIDKTLVRAKSSGEHPTVGIIVVGDEILKAQVKDTNSFYACNLLYKHGVKVHKIAIVRDDVEDIAKEVKEFSKKFNYVFTSGGIGPTHDDVTYEAVAMAFNDVLHYHPTLMDIVKNRFGCETFPSPSYKMAYIPTKSVLKFGINEATGQMLPYPCIVMQNVFLFPGSPMFFETSFQALCKDAFAAYKCFATDEVYMNEAEESFANVLSAVARECPNVSFGSYPERNRYYKVRITIESKNKEDTETAKKMFCERVPSNVVVHYDHAPHVNCLAKLENLLGQPQHRSIYESSFNKFVDYYQKPEKVWVYLDGSKESIIMTHLARVASNKLQQYSKQKLHAVNFTFDCVEPGISGFFREISDRYDVELCSLQSDKIDADLAIQHLTALRPELRILLLGKRLNGNEREIYQTLERINWNNPCVSVRVHFPLINWTDEDVVTFVDSLFLPYYTTETEWAR